MKLPWGYHIEPPQLLESMDGADAKPYTYTYRQSDVDRRVKVKPVGGYCRRCCDPLPVAPDGAPQPRNTTGEASAWRRGLCAECQRQVADWFRFGAARLTGSPRARQGKRGQAVRVTNKRRKEA